MCVTSSESTVSAGLPRLQATTNAIETSFWFLFARRAEVAGWRPGLQPELRGILAQIPQRRTLDGEEPCSSVKRSLLWSLRALTRGPRQSCFLLHRVCQQQNGSAE